MLAHCRTSGWNEWCLSHLVVHIFLAGGFDGSLVMSLSRRLFVFMYRFDTFQSKPP